MSPSLLLFSIVFLCIAVLAVRWRTEGFVDATSSTEPAHTSFVQSSQDVFNKISNQISLPDSPIPLTNAQAQQVQSALGGITATPQKDTYALDTETPYTTPSEVPSHLADAAACEAATKSCSAFDDPTFAANCGMSFDLQGMDSKGKMTTGGSGLYVSPNDRDVYTKRAQTVKDTGSAPYDPFKVYQPTIGKAAPGTFALTKDQCVIVKERADCEAKQTFGVSNCTQCYSSQHFSRVGPETGRMESKLVLVGANGTIRSNSTVPQMTVGGAVALSDSAPFTLTIPPNAEGAVVDLVVEGRGAGAGGTVYVAGYLEGPTARGMYRLDLQRMVQSDKVSGAKPRMSGTKSINGVRCVSMIPATGKTTMTLSCLIPFSFIDPHDSDVLGCDNGPVITKASSATFLESDPCFSKANAVGAYTLECLQDRWVSLGGTQQGTGYPSTKQKADALQKGADGKGLDIDTVIDQLSVKIRRALSGTDESGTPLSIADWNSLSMWALGIPIESPCDGAQAGLGTSDSGSGGLSKACLSYLYANKGATTHVGGTYTMIPSQSASTKGQAVGDLTPNTYCQPGAGMDPATDSGLAFAKQAMGAAQGPAAIQAIKQAYDRVHRLANDNTKSNQDRSDAMKQCYNVNLKPVTSNKVVGPTQVFAVGPGYQYTKGQAQEVCARYGAQVATTAQLADAQQKGADWCFSAWVADGANGKWPVTTSVIGGCGGRRGIIEWTHESGKAGVNCYGPKPSINDVPAGEIKPFNGENWDQPAAGSGTQYVSVRGGYLQTSAAQPSCFSGLSPEQAQENCNQLGENCGGISYSVDGSGNGCYKGNVEGGMVNDPNYMGYIKTPANPVKPDRDRTKPPPGYSQGVCNPGYYDYTKGSHAWWGCGAGCPGGMYWTDLGCGCACKPNAADP